MAITFEAWCKKLDQVVIKDGYQGPSIVAETGAACWRHYYDDGETPEAAWAEELTNA